MPLSLLHKSYPTEFKFAAEPGSFDGYAAVFGNVDQGGDVIAPGAFKQFARTRDGSVLVLYQHSMNDPIGKAQVTQDERGLRVSGQLATSDPIAARAYGLMKSGLLDAMSIGYEVLPGGAKHVDGNRMLTDLKLYEVSVVTFGMNDQARVDAVKTMQECRNIRELEHLLRENPYLRLSNRKAKKIANLAWPILNECEAQDDAREERTEMLVIAKSLDVITQLLKDHK